MPAIQLCTHTRMRVGMALPLYHLQTVVTIDIVNSGLRESERDRERIVCLNRQAKRKCRTINTNLSNMQNVSNTERTERETAHLFKLRLHTQQASICAYARTQGDNRMTHHLIRLNQTHNVLFITRSQ